MAKYPVKDLARRLQQLMLHFPAIAGNEALNYFLDSFKKQAWDGTAWQTRSDKTWGNARKKKYDEGRALLVKKGHLRRSIRIVETRIGYVRIASDRPYAQIHNEGGTINATQNVGAHTRKAHKVKAHSRKNGAQVKAHTVKQQSVSAHNRTVSIKIPKRQFMGNSPILNQIIKDELQRSFGELITQTKLFDSI